MKLKMYSVYDSKAECFGTPFFMSSRGLAIRAFTDLVNDTRSSVNKYPGDFSLFEVGEWDDNNARVESFAPVSLGIAQSYVKEAEVVKVPGNIFQLNGTSDESAKVR